MLFSVHSRAEVVVVGCGTSIYGFGLEFSFWQNAIPKRNFGTTTRGWTYSINTLLGFRGKIRKHQNQALIYGRWLYAFFAFEYKCVAILCAATGGSSVYLLWLNILFALSQELHGESDVGAAWCGSRRINFIGERIWLKFAGTISMRRSELVS